MRTRIKDDYDREEAKRLGAEPWQLALLDCNPEYTCWGPHEDYMARRGRDEGPDGIGRTQDHGWESRVLSKSWAEFGPWELNDLNELVNFYFEVTRACVPCETCNGNGYHPDAQWVSESFYEHSNPFHQQTARAAESAMVLASFTGSLPKGPAVGQECGNYPSDETLAKYSPEFREFCEGMANGGRRWDKSITQDETQALFDSHRLGNGKCPTAAEVNAGGGSLGPFGHDAINRSILVRTRCERYGIPVTCPRCDGHGEQFTSAAARVDLILWFIHPRKGCSRGVEVQNIQQSELPDVKLFLERAAQRNADRFAGLSKL